MSKFLKLLKFYKKIEAVMYKNLKSILLLDLLGLPNPIYKIGSIFSIGCVLRSNYINLLDRSGQRKKIKDYIYTYIYI